MGDAHMLSAEEMGALRGIEGLISEEVGLRLAALASAVPSTQVIVEIGSYKGKSTCYLGAGARAGQGAHVYAVDPWTLPGNTPGRFKFDSQSVMSDFARNIDAMKLNDLVTPFHSFSLVAARTWANSGYGTRIGLLYIDGSHTAADVLTDWMSWSPFLARGASVAFDDYDTARNPGVKRVVDTLRAIKGSEWELGPHPLIVGKMP